MAAQLLLQIYSKPLLCARYPSKCFRWILHLQIISFTNEEMEAEISQVHTASKVVRVRAAV